MSPFLKLLRPYQWTKNLICFAGAVFGGRLFDPAAVLRDAAVFAAFCAASSAMYILNDLRDIELDRLHPKKRYRPLPAGEIKKPAASVIACVLATLALGVGVRLGLATLVCISSYLLINVTYSLCLKNSLLLDVGCVAMGFVLRLLGGVYVLNDMPTAWIALCTLFLALFLGFAKRRAELFRLQNADTAQRPVLNRYSVNYLDSLLNSTANMAVLSYALFTTTSGKSPTLVITVPIVYYAVMRYKHLVMVEEVGEEPEMILVHNVPIQLSILLWIVCFVAIFYGKLHLFR